MGLDKRMKKRMEQIDKNLDAIVKNPYQKEIVEKKPKRFPSWTKWALPFGGAVLTASLALGIVLPITLLGGLNANQGTATASVPSRDSNYKDNPREPSGSMTKNNPNHYDEYKDGTYTPENVNCLISPDKESTRAGVTSRMSETTYNSYRAFAKKFVTLMMEVNNPLDDEKSMAISLPDAYLSLAITGIISDENGLQDVLSYLELENISALKNAAKQIISNLGTMEKDYGGNDVGGLNLNSIWLNPEKMSLLAKKDEDLYRDLKNIFEASLYLDGLTSNKAKQYISENGLPDKPIPNIELPHDDDPAAVSIMSVYYDMDVFEAPDRYRSEYNSGQHTMSYTVGGQTKQVDYIEQVNFRSQIVENDNLTGATLSLDNSHINFFLPKDETAMPSAILGDVLDENYSIKEFTYLEDDEEKSTSLCTVDISAPYFFIENKACLNRQELTSVFPSLTSHGVASRLASSKNGLPVALESIMQFSTMRFDYNGFYSCSATIVISDTSAAHSSDVIVDFDLNRPYVFERSRYIRSSDGDYYEVPIIVGEIVDPNYLV
ncbi:MAG: hypothetical protein IKM80_00115 [Bacilli bacterium]|nr:hypothetical protein [Bacilli bacterium]